MGVLGNIGSAITGISMGDFAQKALQFVGVPKSFAAGVGALVDLKRGNLVGAMQNGLEALTGTESLSEGFKRLQGKKCASAHSCQRPSSCFGKTAKVAGYAAAGVGGAAVIGGMGGFGAQSSVASGMGKFMAGIAGGVALLGMGSFAGGGKGIASALGMGGSSMFGLTMSNNAAIHKAKKAVGYSNIDSELAKLPPNATFEQMVHAFMKGAVKDQEEEVKGIMDKMKKQETGSASGGGIGGFFRKILGGAAGLIPGIGKNISAGITGEGTKGKESRALMMEDMKFKMQTLTQMMQALSNVGNTMHQGSMNAIRNIRA